jgi:hypothetical protein
VLYSNAGKIPIIYPIMFKCLAPVNYTTGAPGDYVASGSSLVLPRAAADTRGQSHTTLYRSQHSALCHARAAEGGAGGEERREKEGRGNGGRGEGSRSGCLWQGSRGLGGRRMRWMEACHEETGVMKRPCATVWRGGKTSTQRRRLYYIVVSECLPGFISTPSIILRKCCSYRHFIKGSES